MQADEPKAADTEMECARETVDESSDQSSLLSKSTASRVTPAVLCLLGAALLLAVVANANGVVVTSPSHSVEGSGCQASAVVPGAPYGTPLVIYYWPVLARAAALFRMADAASYPYIHVSNRSELAAMVSSNRVHGSGGSSDMFAPPVVKDGDFIVSQVVLNTFGRGPKGSQRVGSARKGMGSAPNGIGSARMGMVLSVW